MTTAPVAASRRALVTIGWTLSDRGPGGTGYSSYDGWEPGAQQATRTISFDVPANWDDERICWAVVEATNAPSVRDGEPPAAIVDAIIASGYNGAEAHWSFSRGDTVTVHHTEAGPDGPSVRYASTGYAFERVEG